MKTEAQARQEAAELARRMGDGWQPDVWENCGWHFDVSKGRFKIHPEHAGRYSAWIEPDAMVGVCAVQFIAHGDTPEDALGFAVQDARTLIARVEAVLNDTEEAA